MPELYFENTVTQKRYKIVRFNKEEGTVTLVGPHQREFTVEYTKEKLQKWGYKLIQVDAPPALPPPPVPAAATA